MPLYSTVLVARVHSRGAQNTLHETVFPPLRLVSSQRRFLSCLEGYPVTEWLARHGLAAAVLRYRLLPSHGLDEALDDLEDAVTLLRRLRPGPVVAMGFSAGGHLVASLGARHEERRPGTPQPLDGQVVFPRRCLPLPSRHLFATPSPPPRRPLAAPSPRTLPHSAALRCTLPHSALLHHRTPTRKRWLVPGHGCPVDGCV